MKHKCKAKITLFLLAIIVVVSVCALTGCKGDEVTNIYITNNDLPRLDYVEGQELDLSDGRLTIIINGEEESTLPLNSSDVTVSGYDKNLVGSQVVTIGYGGMTTTINVNVVARAVSENVETKYFVGDTFNKNKGKIQITTDDMKTFAVNMSDERVSLVSFDSSVAGPATVTVQYNDGKDAYYCQFGVTVYEESNIEFTAPTKTRYNSSDTELSVSGGFLKVTSSDSKLTKHVPLSEEMIKGFDLTAATIANRNEPVEQTITVEYLGKTFEYTIYVTFDSLSVVNYHAKNGLANIDWSAVKENGLNEEQSIAAIDAINEYYKLSQEQMELVSYEDRGVIIRAGTVAVAMAFYKELGEYSGTFQMDQQQNLYFIRSSYEQTVADLEKLNDPAEEINVYAELLRRIEAEYGNAQLMEGVMIADYIIVYTAEMQQTIMEVLDHLTRVYSQIKDIPKDWTAESLKEYDDEIMVAAMQIYSAGYYKSGYPQYYTTIMSPWREQNDVFDILYTYFLYDYEGGQEFILKYMFGSVPLPGKLEDWYQGLNNALGWRNHFSQNATGSALLSDVSGFMYQYFRTVELSEEIKASDNPLLLDIYKAVNGDYLNQYYIHTYSYGYLYHVKGMIDSPAFHKLWNDYYAVLKVYYTGKLSAVDHKEQICKLFDSFEELTPDELLGFLSSLNLMYTNAKGVVPMLDCGGETVYNIFALVMKQGYMTYLNEANKALFADLLLAMENYALINYKENAMATFNDMMQKLISEYDALSDADKANFDEYAGVSFRKYREIYDLAAGNKQVQMTEEEKTVLNELESALDKYFNLYAFMLEQAEQWQEVSKDLYAAFYSQYAQVRQAYDNVLNVVSEDVLMTMYAVPCDVLDGKFTLAQAYYEADYITTSILLGQNAVITMTDGNKLNVTAWDLFAGYGMPEVLLNMSELLYDMYFGEGFTVEKGYVLSLISQVRGLNGLQASILSYLGNENAYYKALDVYLATVLSEGAKNAKVVEALFNAEKAYIAYSRDNTNAENRDLFISLMEQVKAAYEALTEEDKTYLDETYHYYLDLYEQIKATSAAA